MRAARGLVVTALLLTVARHAMGACGDDPGDAAALGDARAQVESDCGCAAASSHAGYIRCAIDVARQRVEAKLLPPDCQRPLRRCAARSICGRPGFVTCCRTRAGGTRCALERSVAACAAPARGSACVGVFSSCCDACVAGGCTPPTTTSTTTSTTTTSVTTTTFPLIPCVGGEAPVCGGTCDLGLGCRLLLTAPDTFSCACLPEATGCGSGTAFPACSVGVCPEDFVCGAFVLTLDPSGVCGCVHPSVGCEGNILSGCAHIGLCPPGFACHYLPPSFPPGPFQCPCCGCGPA